MVVALDARRLRLFRDGRISVWDVGFLVGMTVGLTAGGDAFRCRSARGSATTQVIAITAIATARLERTHGNLMIPGE